MRFFLGSNTPRGFVSHFQTVYDVRDGWKVWIIKGGAGTGKSGMMKKIAKAAQKVTETQWVYCSSDPNSLDAVVLPEKKRAIFDGTAPHVVEPRLVGACENIINVGAFWDCDYLYDNRNEIFELNGECSRCHSRATRYINAANTFNRDSQRMLKPYLNTEAALEAADLIANKEFGVDANATGKVAVRLLSAVTPEGITFFEDSISENCEKVVGIKDEYSVASPIIMERLAQRATDCGYNITVCLCSMSEEKIEHILIPQLKLAFSVQSRYHCAQSQKCIDTEEFFNQQAFKDHKEKVDFNTVAADGLFKEASESVAQAKEIHDRLEKIYIDSMNFAPVNKLTEDLISMMTE